jgi:hypothetical protein
MAALRIEIAALAPTASGNDEWARNLTAPLNGMLSVAETRL